MSSSSEKWRLLIDGNPLSRENSNITLAKSTIKSQSSYSIPSLVTFGLWDNFESVCRTRPKLV